MIITMILIILSPYLRHSMIDLIELKFSLLKNNEVLTNLNIDNI